MMFFSNTSLSAERNNPMQQPVESRYKFLNFTSGKLRSEKGNCTWTIGVWQEVAETPLLCNHGFHCSSTLLDAFLNIPRFIAAKVEVAGAAHIGEEKEAWQLMRIIEVWHWEAQDSIELAIFAASLVLYLFELYYPDDQRPRSAIEVAKAYLTHRTQEYADRAHKASLDVSMAEYSTNNNETAKKAARAARHTANAAHLAHSNTFWYLDAADAVTAAIYAGVRWEDRKRVHEKINAWMMERLAKKEPFLPPSGTQGGYRVGGAE
jgi:hypothetical protein